MLRLLDISLDLNYKDETLVDIAAQKLGISKKFIKSAKLFKRSVDARRKNNVHFMCSIDVEFINNFKDENKLLGKKVIAITPYKYECINPRKLPSRPLVVGFGPAGIFASLILSECGCNPIVIERGKKVDERTTDIEKFWRSSKLNTESNVQFGEGGAGTFSDGKLNTGTKDTRSRKVLEEFVECGAPEEILYLTKPHIGTDKLKTTVKNLRKKIMSLGAEIRFETKLIDIIIKNNCIAGAVVKNGDRIYEIETDSIILAIGHSARDTFETLYNKSIFMEQKAFSVGARIEHSQIMINKNQYGSFYNHKALGAADYKLAVHLNNGRGVYTFCMCPGGEVVAASSEANRLVTNGMSEFSRDKQNANSALLVGVSPMDFESDHPLAGIQFQRNLEEKAFKLGGSNYNAPIQCVGDFLNGKASSKLGSIKPSYRPGYKLTDLSLCFPKFVTESLRLGIIEMDKRIHGFACPDAILTAAETRSSSPVRITRQDNNQSINISGLYPCGEGAGYAGGIISAAVDGIKTAENFLKN